MGSHSASDRALLLRVIAERVRVRFALSAADFADRLQSAAFLADSTGSDLSEQLRKLALDDLYLAAACADGDETAWRDLELNHFPFIRDFARRVLRRGNPEDVAAQVIGDLWQRRKIAQFEGRSSLRTWLGSVVIRTAINAASGRTEKVVPLDQASIDSRPESRHHAPDQHGAHEDAKLLARLLVRAIERLDSEDRLLVFLYYDECLTLEQIQPAFRASKATLSRRLARIRGRLRDDLAALLRTETGEASIEALRDGLVRAGFEFDLSSALGDSFRLLQGNRRSRV